MLSECMAKHQVQSLTAILPTPLLSSVKNTRAPTFSAHWLRIQWFGWQSQGNGNRLPRWTHHNHPPDNYDGRAILDKYFPHLLRHDAKWRHLINLRSEWNVLMVERWILVERFFFQTHLSSGTFETGWLLSFSLHGNGHGQVMETFSIQTWPDRYNTNNTQEWLSVAKVLFLQIWLWLWCWFHENCCSCLYDYHVEMIFSNGYDQDTAKGCHTCNMFDFNWMQIFK